MSVLAYDVAGEGPGLLLLHCGVADRRQWGRQWAALTARHRVVAVDLRGFGDTPLPTESGWNDSADLLAVLDEVGLDQVAVAGSSYGGRIALELATVAPQRVHRLLLLCAAVPGMTPTPDAEAYDAQEQALLEAGDVDGAVALNVSTWLGPDADEQARADLAAWQRHTFDVQLTGPDVGPDRPDVDVTRIDVPTTVYLGHHDLQQFQNAARDVAAAMPRARLVELDWAGHLPNLERPEQTEYLMLAELAETGD